MTTTDDDDSVEPILVPRPPYMFHNLDAIVVFSSIKLPCLQKTKLYHICKDFYTELTLLVTGGSIRHSLASESSFFLSFFLFFDNFSNRLSFSEERASENQTNPTDQAISTTAEEAIAGLPGNMPESWTFGRRNGYHNNDHLYRSRDIRYSPYPTQTTRNTFMTNTVPPSFHHRPTPVMFSQSFAHPVYGSYPVPSGYVSSCDVYTPETNIENTAGDMFNIPIGNKY